MFGKDCFYIVLGWSYGLLKIANEEVDYSQVSRHKKV